MFTDSCDNPIRCLRDHSPILRQSNSKYLKRPVCCPLSSYMPSTRNDSTLVLYEGNLIGCSGCNCPGVSSGYRPRWSLLNSSVSRAGTELATLGVSSGVGITSPPEHPIQTFHPGHRRSVQGIPGGEGGRRCCGGDWSCRGCFCRV